MADCIIYLHGFNSSPASIKGQQLARAIAAMPASLRPEFHLPQLPHRPSEAIRALTDLIEANRERALTLVGSSLGGFYATWLAERFDAKAVLINPAIRPHADLSSYLGPQKNPYTGDEYELTMQHLDELRASAVPQITHPERYFLLVETGDELLDAHQAIAYYGGAWQYTRSGGDHAFSEFVAQIPAILRFATLAAPEPDLCAATLQSCFRE